MMKMNFFLDIYHETVQRVQLDQLMIKVFNLDQLACVTKKYLTLKTSVCIALVLMINHSLLKENIPFIGALRFIIKN